jgi:hypothetical protein
MRPICYANLSYLKAKPKQFVMGKRTSPYASPQQFWQNRYLSNEAPKPKISNRQGSLTNETIKTKGKKKTGNKVQGNACLVWEIKVENKHAINSST